MEVLIFIQNYSQNIPIPKHIHANLKHTHVHVKVYPLTSQNAPIIIYIHLMYAGTLEREKIYTAECTK